MIKSQKTQADKRIGICVVVTEQRARKSLIENRRIRDRTEKLSGAVTNASEGTTVDVLRFFVIPSFEMCMRRARVFSLYLLSRTFPTVIWNYNNTRSDWEGIQSALNVFTRISVDRRRPNWLCRWLLDSCTPVQHIFTGIFTETRDGRQSVRYGDLPTTEEAVHGVARRMNSFRCGWVAAGGWRVVNDYLSLGLSVKNVG